MCTHKGLRQLYLTEKRKISAHPIGFSSEDISSREVQTIHPQIRRAETHPRQVRRRNLGLSNRNRNRLSSVAQLLPLRKTPQTVRMYTGEMQSSPITSLMSIISLDTSVLLLIGSVDSLSTNHLKKGMVTVRRTHDESTYSGLWTRFTKEVFVEIIDSLMEPDHGKS